MRSRWISRRDGYAARALASERGLTLNVPSHRSQPSRDAGSQCGQVDEDSPGGYTRASPSRTTRRRSTLSQVITENMLAHLRRSRARSAGMIVVAGQGATLWSLDERGALPVWARVGSLPCVIHPPDTSLDVVELEHSPSQVNKADLAGSAVALGFRPCNGSAGAFRSNPGLTCN